MRKRIAVLALLIIAVVVFWMRPEKRVGRNADAGSFILSAHAQTSNYGGVSITSYATNCVPVAPTAASLSCSALVDNATQVISTEPIRVPLGAVGADAVQFNAAGAGFYSQGSNNVTFDAGGARFYFSNTGITTAGGMGNSFNGSSSIGVAGDTFFGRRTTATWGLGAIDVNGVPVAQTLGVQGAITGTDLPGSLFSLVGSLGTGAGLPAPVSIKGADQSVATGATAQTGIHRLVVGDTKNLTTGAATTVLSIPLATLQMAGATITYHMEATDGTNQCTRDGVMTFSAENSAGVFVTNLTNSAGANDSTACTATKTLTEAWAVTSANPALVQVTPTLTGITATRFSLNYSVVYGGNTQPTL